MSNPTQVSNEPIDSRSAVAAIGLLVACQIVFWGTAYLNGKGLVDELFFPAFVVIHCVSAFVAVGLIIGSLVHEMSEGRADGGVVLTHMMGAFLALGLSGLIVSIIGYFAVFFGMLFGLFVCLILAVVSVFALVVFCWRRLSGIAARVLKEPTPPQTATD